MAASNRLWLKVVLVGLASGLAALATFLVVLVLCIAAGRKQAQCDAAIAVDWKQMPIEATGGKRGVVGNMAKDAVMDGLRRSVETFAASDQASRLSVPASALGSILSVSVVSGGSSGELVVVHVCAVHDQASTAGEVVQAYLGWVQQALGGYRFMEMLGKAHSDKVEIDTLRERGDYRGAKALDDESGRNLMFSFLMSNPVQVTEKPTMSEAIGRNVAVGLVVGLVAGVVIGGLVALTGTLVCVLFSRRANGNVAASRSASRG